jgi:4-amino-4-deoxy-L-arabinose transferase-like glycosyltransferase
VTARVPRACGRIGVPQAVGKNRITGESGEHQVIKTPSSDFNTIRWLVALAVVAFLLRVYGIAGLPYNYDEPQNVEIISSLDFSGFHLPLRSFQHPPLSVYVLKTGTVVFGENPFGFRFMNALVGALSVMLIYILARRGFDDERAGLAAALLLATNRFHIGWSRLVNQEVLYLALVIVTLVVFWRAWSRGKGWPAVGVAAALALLAKELAVLLIPALGIFLVTSAKGRAVLRRKEVWAAFGIVAVVAVALLVYALRHPAREEMNLGVNLYRLQSIGISVEPLEFFFAPSTTHDAPLQDAWTYPSMFWPTGAILLAGVVGSIRRWKDDFTRLMLVVFGFYFLCFTVVGTDMSRIPFHQGEFWWVDVALIPAVILTARALVEVKDHGAVGARLFWVVPVYLGINAIFFVAVTNNGPVLRLLGVSYAGVVGRLPFLF